MLIDRRGSVSITDQMSTNGTFVNGQRLEPLQARRLEEGDRIQIGTSVVLKLVFLDPSDERFQHEMFERTVRDGIDGLYNRPTSSIRSGDSPRETRRRGWAWRS